MLGSAIVSKISGLDPWPIATADICGTALKIFKAFYTVKDNNLSVGTVINTGREGIEVACLDGSVTITELQAPGGRRMKAADYLRGHPICL